jgi:hypothetical protein
MSPEEERIRFYAAIGEGITEWSHIEDGLYTAFIWCLPEEMRINDNHKLIAAAYYSTDAFRTKLGMVDAVIELRLARKLELLNCWIKLYKAINKRVYRRNELAHHQVYFEPKAPKGRKYTLIPAYMDHGLQEMDLIHWVFI